MREKDRESERKREKVGEWEDVCGRRVFWIENNSTGQFFRYAKIKWNSVDPRQHPSPHYVGVITMSLDLLKQAIKFLLNNFFPSLKKKKKQCLRISRVVSAGTRFV